jgi:hypothetical protein
MRKLFLLSSIVLLAACGSDQDAEVPAAEAPVACDSGSGIEVYCGFENPEDLVLLPDGGHLLVSEMGEFMVHGPSGLRLLDLSSGQRKEIEIDWVGEGWGDSSCPAPPTELFSPHGIDFIQKLDGSYQLLVVNHGGRESVEFFELQIDEQQIPTGLVWRGCAIPPGDPFINDVAGLQDGGFVVTHMWDKSTAFPVLVAKLLAGTKTGWVYEWQADTGFKRLEDSVEMMPNGIAVNADNSKIFVNIYMGNKTIRIDRETGKVDGSFEVQQPDNITVDSDGQLWVASHRHDPIDDTCTEPGVCLHPFAVVRADPETMTPEVVFEHSGAPMGYSTVALKVADRVFMGSAHGDRIASFAP